MSAGADVIIPKKLRPPNPVYDHLTRRRKWPSVRMAVILGIALTIIGTLAVTIGWRPPAPTPAPHSGGMTSPSSAPAQFMILLSLMVALSSPFISAALAALTTTRFAEGEAFTMLKLTNILPRKIIGGVLSAALFRLRLLWVICFGLLIPLLAALTIMSLEMRQIFAQFDGGTAPPITAADIRSALGGVIPVVIGGWVVGMVFNWLAICLGISTGLRRRSPVSALVISLVWTLITLIIFIFCVGFILFASTGEPCAMLLTLVVFILIYRFLGADLLRHAQEKL